MRAIRMWLAQRCVVHIGSNRVVIDLMRLGFVVKLPILHFVVLWRTLRMFCCESRICPEFFCQFLRLFTLPVDLTEVAGVKTLLFKGIADNWREFWFCATEWHPFAHPTYFSLFGLINIQKRGDALVVSREEFVQQIKTLVGETMFYADAHHFSVRSNFCVSNGRLRMVDYGSTKTRKVIRERGMCVYRNFQIDSA